MVNTEEGTVALLDEKLKDNIIVLDFLATQRHIGPKYLERLICKLLYVHIVGPGSVTHLYHI